MGWDNQNPHNNPTKEEVADLLNNSWTITNKLL